MRKKKRMILLFALLLVFFVAFSRDKRPDQQAFAVQLPETEAIAPKKPNPVRVLSYNMHRGVGQDGKLDMARILDVISGSNADVVTLQEVERYSIRTEFQDQIGYLADKLSMSYAYGKSLNILNGQYGNAILSRYPIESYQLEQLPSRGENRTMLQADLNVNGRKLLVYTTHLGLDREERKEQIQSILDRIRNSGTPHVLTGDFNGLTEELAALTELYTDSAVRQDMKQLGTFTDGEESSRIDYILLSGKLKLLDYIVLESDASDHYPILSTIDFEQ